MAIKQADHEPGQNFQGLVAKLSHQFNLSYNINLQLFFVTFATSFLNGNTKTMHCLSYISIYQTNVLCQNLHRLACQLSLKYISSAGSLCPVPATNCCAVTSQ